MDYNMKKEFNFLSYDGCSQIHTIEWSPEIEARAILQITHGMKEYIDRYDDFAKYLNQFGIYVVGQDHLGHGQSANEKRYGFFHESQGNECLMNDMRSLHLITEAKYPRLPYFILGHSMGSFLVRQYIGHYGRYLDGAIIMGTAQQPKQLIALAKNILALGIQLKGPYYTNHSLDVILTRFFNHHFQPVTTFADWISKDEAEVRKYVENPWCTFDFTFSAYYEMLKSMQKMNEPRILHSIPKSLPIFLISGEDDPVGNFGKGVYQVYERYQQLGLSDVTIRLYPTDRHEILHETDRLVVYEDIYQWLEKHFKEENT